MPVIQGLVLGNAKPENITSECKKLTQLLIINPIWAKTTQIRTLIQMQTRENTHYDGVGSTWNNVMVEVSLGTAGKWDDEYKRRTQSKGDELWGLRVTEEKEKSREKKVHWGVQSRKQNLAENGMKSLHSLNSTAYHSLGWKSLISSFPSPGEQQGTANKWVVHLSLGGFQRKIRTGLLEKTFFLSRQHSCSPHYRKSNGALEQLT